MALLGIRAGRDRRRGLPTMSALLCVGEWWHVILLLW